MSPILSYASKYLFLIDRLCKLNSEWIGTIENSQKWMPFQQCVPEMAIIELNESRQSPKVVRFALDKPIPTKIHSRE